ncbi:HAD family hydrolase [Virgibacillus proomii]|jgi:beta-phosphoglucomutase-like phosphatase (HAD superfamily)|uniref:HAD family hydrolase n=1 Tax=Virgibacillus proomii TaxID=84407 RepID=UPI001FE5B828|nr:HAD hydrolase-like protein [Virgibacillus proomii]
MFIGDSDADIQAGLEANVHTIGVKWFPNAQTLTFSKQPDAYFDDITEFVNYVERQIDNLLHCCTENTAVFMFIIERKINIF